MGICYGISTMTVGMVVHSDDNDAVPDQNAVKSRRKTLGSSDEDSEPDSWFDFESHRMCLVKMVKVNSAS